MGDDMINTDNIPSVSLHTKVYSQFLGSYRVAEARIYKSLPVIWSSLNVIVLPARLEHASPVRGTGGSALELRQRMGPCGPFGQEVVTMEATSE